MSSQFLIKVNYNIAEEQFETCLSESFIKVDIIFVCEQLLKQIFNSLFGATVHHAGISLNTSRAEEEILADKMHKNKLVHL